MSILQPSTPNQPPYRYLFTAKEIAKFEPHLKQCFRNISK